MVLLIPAAVGLFALAQPVIRLLFEHGVFGATDTAMTASALRLYLLGLVFAGIDFLLNYTFYARQDTRTPAIVGVVAVGFYFVAAWNLMPVLGFLGLVLADSIKQAGHAIIMAVLLRRSMQRVGGLGAGGTLLKAGAAALAMGLLVGFLADRLAGLLPAGFLGELALVAVAASAGAAFYVLILRLWGVKEVVDLQQGLLARLRPARP